jgi:hypothetical protein
MSMWDISTGDDLPDDSDVEEVGDSLLGSDVEVSNDDGDSITIDLFGAD